MTNNNTLGVFNDRLAVKEAFAYIEHRTVWYTTLLNYHLSKYRRLFQRSTDSKFKPNSKDRSEIIFVYSPRSLKRKKKRFFFVCADESDQT